MEPITVRQSSVDEIEHAPNIDALLAEYAQESSIDGLGQASAQFEQYRNLESLGVLHVIGAFIGDRLAGFINLIASPLPHYGRLVASTESFFVSQADRKRGAGLMLLAEAERMASSLGAAGLFVSAPVGGKLDMVMGGMPGYRQTNRVHFRALA